MELTIFPFLQSKGGPLHEKNQNGLSIVIGIASSEWSVMIDEKQGLFRGCSDNVAVYTRVGIQ